MKRRYFMRWMELGRTDLERVPRSGSALAASQARAPSPMQWRRVLELAAGPYSLTTAAGYTVTGLSAEQLSELLAEFD